MKALNGILWRAPLPVRRDYHSSLRRAGNRTERRKPNENMERRA